MSGSSSSSARVSSSRSRTEEIGKYRLLKTIGKGNFAKVKLAKHIPTGKEVRGFLLFFVVVLLYFFSRFFFFFVVFSPPFVTVLILLSEGVSHAPCAAWMRVPFFLFFSFLLRALFRTFFLLDSHFFY